MKKLTSLIPFALVLAIGLGALVNYLSNTVTYTANIESPFEISVLEEDSTLAGTIYGGGTYSAVYEVKNRANNPVEGKHQLVIIEPDACNLDDVIGIKLYKDGVDTEVDFDTKCEGNNYIITSDYVSVDGSRSSEFEYKITFNPAIKPGEYSFEITILP